MKKTGNILPLLLFVSILLLACTISASPTSTTTPEPTATLAPTIAPTTTPLALPTAHLLQDKIEDYLESQNNLSGYTIEVVYPTLTGDDTSSQEFNRSAQAQVEHIIEYFKKDIGEMGELPTDMVSHESSLQIDYDIIHAEDDLVSVLFQISIYYAGAAHPSHFTEVLNFDLVDGKTAELADLFKPGTDYLLFLSDYCLEDLEKQGVLEWEDGALPKPENYRSWNINADGLMITFDQYTVAPYAAGPQTVIIPFEKMSNLLDPAGLLGRVIT